MVYKIQRLLFLLAMLPGLAQTNSLNNGDFSRLSYDELYEIMVSDQDSVTIDEAFEAYYKNAGKDKDTLEMAQALRLHAYNLNFQESLKSVDSAIAIANTIKQKDKRDVDKFRALAFYTKASILYNNYKDEKAVEAFIQSFQYSKKVNYNDLAIRTLAVLASIKAEFGQESESILLQKRNIELLEKRRNEINDYQNLKLDILSKMARCYAFNMEIDSARIYINEAMEIASITNQNSFVDDLKILQAQLSYYEGDIINAKNVLESYVKDKNGTPKADIQFYLGMIEGKLGNIERKKKYFESYDSIMQRFGFPFYDNSNEVYQFLVREAVNDDDKKMADKYLNRLVYYDSLLLSTQKNLREITLKKFDLPMQEEEKQMLGDIISKKSKWLTWFYVLSGIMLIGLSAYYLKYLKIKKRLAYALSHRIDLDNPTLSPERQEAGDNKLDEEIVAKVLRNLEDWEEQKGFLDKNLTQQTLAKELNTNSAYLSQVINVHKKQNFASYLKDLRITHAINDLKSNPEIVQIKSMIQIAERYGFNSVGVFSKAFKDKIGVTPGVFFKNILET